MVYLTNIVSSISSSSSLPLATKPLLSYNFRATGFPLLHVKTTLLESPNGFVIIGLIETVPSLVVAITIAILIATASIVIGHLIGIVRKKRQEKRELKQSNA